MKLINNTDAGTHSGIIDVGGGTSKLSRLLLDQRYKKLAVLDISGTSIEKAKSQLSEKSSRIKWIEADVTKHTFIEQYDVWHDRAVFHLLTEAEDRMGYVASPKATNRTTQIVNHDESNEITDHRVDDFVCYCFEYTRDDIEQDFIKKGRSLIMEKIAAEKKKGGVTALIRIPKASDVCLMSAV